MTADETANAPEGIKTLPLTGMKDYTFTMTVSALTVQDVVPAQMSAQERKATKLLRWLRLKLTQKSRNSSITV